MEKCPICGTNAKVTNEEHGTRCNCPQCGHFELRCSWQGHAVKRHILSWHIRKKYDENGHKLVVIIQADLDDLLTYPEMPLVEKIDALLLAYTDSLYHYRDTVEAVDAKYIAYIQAKDSSEYEYIANILVQKGYIQIQSPQPSTRSYKITPEGWIYAESLSKKTNSTQAFIAIWFDPSMDDVCRNGIEAAIAAAGMKPFRIDKKEHNDKIDDQIIAEIQRSRFMVADFTGHRGGVYFEAGYAMGRGIPVIWTCKKCCLNDLHFDIRQYNMIAWENAEDLKTRLHQRIRATIGEQQ